MATALLLAGVLAAGCAPPPAPPGPGPSAVAANDRATTSLLFLDVGQGDAVLIRAPDGRHVLYDGGRRGGDTAELLRRMGIQELDLVIASHNHADHIGGLEEVIRAFRPRFYMDNGIPATTLTYGRVLEAVEEAGAQLLEPTLRTVGIGELRLRILPPPGEASRGQNDNSVGVMVRYGDFAAFLGGDAERFQWEWWLEAHAGELGPVDLHKASHHGSRNGDIEASLGVLTPGVVVIGVGGDNTYGHPHPEALALYAAAGSRVYRTDRDGHVLVVADGAGGLEVRAVTSLEDLATCTSWEGARLRMRGADYTMDHSHFPGDPCALPP